MPVHTLSKADWGKIHAKAFKDHGFRTRLETDPTGAVKAWFAEEYKDKMTLERIVDLTEWMRLKVTDDENWPPPACC